eukprot:scaffold28222_cov89-Phaeocystis_antarctica.AAC.12
MSASRVRLRVPDASSNPTSSLNYRGLDGLGWAGYVRRANSFAHAGCTAVPGCQSLDCHWA